MRPQYTITRQPSFEPITLAQASEHLRVDSTDDITYLEDLIPVAREFVDSITGRASISTGYKLIAESWDSLMQVSGRILLYRTPLVSVASVKYYAPDATTQTTLATTEYRAITGSEPGMIHLHGTTPDIDDRPDAIEILFTAGHESMSDVAAIQRHLIKMVIGHLYENRLPVAFSSCNEIPYTIKDMIGLQRVGGWVG